MYDQSFTHSSQLSALSASPIINPFVITAVPLSDTLVLSLDGLCELSHSHTNKKLLDPAAMQKLLPLMWTEYLSV